MLRDTSTSTFQKLVVFKRQREGGEECSVTLIAAHATRLIAIIRNPQFNESGILDDLGRCLSRQSNAWS
jgi:hypothetical protein